MIVSRTFTILAATLLVAAFGLLVLAPYDLPLVQGLGALDATLVERMHRAVVHSLGRGVWGTLVTPLLARPIWLIPLSLGIVCVGVATTTNVPATTHRTRRRS